MPAGFTREQGRHAVVPGTQTAALTAVEAVAFVGDVEAVAGGAEVGTGPAGQTTVGLLLPELHILEAGGHLGRSFGQAGRLFQAGPGGLAGGLGIGKAVGAVGQAAAFQQGRALVGHGLQHIAAFHFGHQHVGTFRRGGTAAHPVAEAGAATAGAGQGDDGELVTTGLVVRVREGAVQVGPVQGHVAAGVTGTAAEDHGGLGLRRIVQGHGAFARIIGILGLAVAHQHFALGQHGFLGGHGGLGQGEGLAFLPGLEHDRGLVARLLYRGQHAGALGEVSQKGGQAVSGDETGYAHFHSLSWMFFSSSS